MYQGLTLAPGVAVEFTETADFFRLLNAAQSDVEVIFYSAGREIGSVQNLQAGYAEKFGQTFDRIRMTSAAGGAVEFVVRLGSDVRYDKPPSGVVTVAGQQGAFTSAAATVTNASGQLLAAKANRRFLTVQNNDASGVVYVNLAGAAATAANGLRILPGNALEVQGYCPSGAITAIGSIASNANIVVVEG